MKAEARFIVTTALAFMGVDSLNASQDTIGPNGIRSAGLLDFNENPLTGNGVPIGQVETARPGKPLYDTDANCCNAFINPLFVFLQDAPAGVNEALSLGHAHWVAGVMISTDTVMRAGNATAATGVATEADLYSSAVGGGFSQANDAITAQHLTTITDIRATNFSYGTPLESGFALNGDSLLTSFVDWSATQHNVLYVIAGNNRTPTPVYVPTDEFNGITVASSEKNNVDGVFRNVSAGNDFITGAGGRVLIDMLAPGANIDLVGPNNTVPMGLDRSGTSYAAPHVTGTVALLQQYGDERIMAGATGWGPNAQRHEVMKAVIMNSADKIKDDGTFAPLGRMLGMDRTVLDRGPNMDGVNRQNWLQSEAYTDDTLPLDDQMGVGHLNARRALQQFIPGETNFDAATIPSVGWDYGFTDGFDTIRKYALSTSIPADQFVSITLAWDREVLLNDDDFDGAFDPTESFRTGSVPIDLNLYLLPAGSVSIANAVASSVSTDYSVEHIFHQVQTGGMYEIWVDQQSGTEFSIQPYALAWWTETLIDIIIPPGDYSGNGTVGIEDYLVWKSAYGDMVPAGTGADGNGDGRVDAGDYVFWRNRLPGGSGGGGLASVPEPNGAVTIAIGLVLFVRRMRRSA